MSKFLTETRSPIGMAVYIYWRYNHYEISNISISAEVTNAADFRTLEKEINARFKGIRDVNIINIIYF